MRLLRKFQKLRCASSVRAHGSHSWPAVWRDSRAATAEPVRIVSSVSAAQQLKAAPQPLSATLQRLRGSVPHLNSSAAQNNGAAAKCSSARQPSRAGRVAPSQAGMPQLVLILGVLLPCSVATSAADIPAEEVLSRILRNQESILEQLAALQAVPEEQEEQECPTGWSRHEERCYLIPVTTASWHQAHRDCVLLDSRAGLASVHPSSAHHLRSIVWASRVSLVWVGLLRLAGRRSGWVWSDGSPLDFAKWTSRAPSNYGNSQVIADSSIGATNQSLVGNRWQRPIIGSPVAGIRFSVP